MKSRSFLVSPLSALLVAALAFGAGQSVAAAQQADEAADANVTVDPSMFGGLQYRSLNFTRGGRSTAVAGVAGDPLTYYFGATGGGIWKTEDAGATWNNISDGFIGVGAIGAIEVAPSDANVIYAGTGSACPRGNISIGDGLYRSTDAGKTWSKLISFRSNVGKIAVDPRNPDVAFAAVLGNVFAANEERGVYRTTDGGATWEKVLYVDADTGAVDVEIDPANPRIMLASMWTTLRSPWNLVSGSEQDGVYRSKDGGVTWTKLEGGLPTGLVGRTSVAISPVDGDRMWVLAEGPDDKGGLYRSDDGGDSWRKMNGERKLLQRAWYYIHVYADPQDVDTVYALNVGFFKSIDGGKTFDTQIRVPHGDNHDLWINPNDADIMVNANDGGANVSFNGGGSWSHQRNQPTAEIYRVTVDTRHPYRVYGAQQDNSTASLSSQGGGFGDFGADFYDVGGGESGHIAVDPRNNTVVYAGSYGGTITRTDTDTGLSESVMAYPEAVTGQQAADMRFRFQWNAPIRISPHDPDVVYHTSQHVHRTRDGGKTWEVISPDLSTDDPETQGYSGGPITRDNTGVEVFNTIFAFEESPLTQGLLWAGTDDAKVWVSRNDGGDWTDITPPGIPARATVNMIDPSTHDPGRIHVAVQKYRENDFRPYIYRSDDYGASWQLLTDGSNGIPADHWVRVVREDPERKGLLYAGTEFGMFVSFDDGAHWQSLQLNLPVAPVTDMLVYRDDLVVATQGRAFWILDNLTPLHQVSAQAAEAGVALFSPRRAYRGSPAAIDFWVKEVPESAALEILDGNGEVVRSYKKGASSDLSAFLPPGMTVADVPPQFRFMLAGLGGGLEVKAGHNRLSWDGRYAAQFTRPRGIVMWGGGGGGATAVPGAYTVRLTAGETVIEQPLELAIDPRLGGSVTVAQYQEQLELTRQIGAKLDALWKALEGLRRVKQQMTAVGGMLRGKEGAAELMEMGKQVSDQLTEIEKTITQTEGEGGQDALNFPGRLDNQWANLYGEASGADTGLTAGVRQRYEDLLPEFDAVMARLQEVYAGPLPELNAKIAALQLDAIQVPEMPQR